MNRGGGPRQIDANGQPGQKPILEGVAELDVVEDGVVVVADLDGEDAVVGVGRDGVGVAAVRRQQLHGVAHRLVPEDLAHVLRRQVVEGPVVARLHAQVQDRVDVRGAAGVVALRCKRRQGQ